MAPVRTLLRSRPATPPPVIRRGEPPPQPLTEALELLVQQLQRLTPDWQRPERFHEAKSELVDQLRRLARSPVTLPAPRLRFVPGPERVVERVVYIKVGRRRRPKAEPDGQLAFEFMSKAAES